MQTKLQNTFIKALLLVLSGFSLTAGFTEIQLWPFSLLALSVIFVVINKQRSLKRAFLVGYIFFAAHYASFLAPILYTSLLESLVPAVAASLFTICFVAMLVVLPSLSIVIYYLFTHKLAGICLKALLFAACIVIVEWLRSLSDLTIPLSFAQVHINSPLQEWLPIVGIFGVSFISAITSAMLAYIYTAFCVAYRKRTTNMVSNVSTTDRPYASRYLHTLYVLRLVIVDAFNSNFSVLVLLVATLWFSSYGLQSISWVNTVGTSKVSVVQANIDNSIKWDPRYRGLIVHKYFDLTQSAQNSDLILWPETAAPFTYNRGQQALESLREITEKNNNTLMLGIVAEARRSNIADTLYYNSILALNSDREDYFYNKHILVPFGEYTPLEEYFVGLKRMLDIPLSSFSSGARLQDPFIAGDIIAGLYICYESMFPDYIRNIAKDANILVTVTDDSWLGSTLGPYQHLQIAQIRSAELRRYTMRSANTGISAIIDERGKLVQQAGLLTDDVITGEVKLMQGATPFARFGSWPVVILCLLLMLTSALICYRHR